MNIRVYSLIMILATILAWLGWSLVIVNFSPEQAEVTVFLLFYVLLFLAGLGTFSLLGLWSRKVFSRQKLILRAVALKAFRQGVILSAVVVTSLWLQALRVLTWWNILLLIVLAVVVELVFVVFSKELPKDSSE